MAIIDRTNWAQEQRKLQQEIEKALRICVVFMAEVGETATTYARLHGGYTDRTRNLRGSIGYLVIQNGEVKVDAFGTTEPQQMARTYAYQVSKDYPNGTVLIWVAGMNYAGIVQAKGFDVLEGSGNFIESQSQRLKERFEQYLLSA